MGACFEHRIAFSLPNFAVFFPDAAFLPQRKKPVFKAIQAWVRPSLWKALSLIKY